MPNEFIVKNGLISQGNITISGSITATGGVTVSGSIASASYASNAELLDGLDSTVFTLTSSFNAQTASFTAFTSSMNSFSASILTNVTALNAKTASFATTGSNTFVGAEVISGSLAISGSGTPFTLNTDTLEITGSLIVTGSTTLTGSLLQLGNFTTTGTIIAQTINVQTVTSSIVYSSGSNVFGNSLGNSQTFTGSVLITGSLTIAGASSATSYSGTTIYGSTAVCSAVGKFSTCLDLGGALTGTSATFSSCVTATKGTFVGTGYVLDLNRTDNTALVQLQYNGTIGSLLGTTGANNFIVYNASASPMLTLSGGAATFSNTITGTTIYGSTAVCSPVGKFTTCLDLGGALNGTTATFSGTICGNGATFTTTGNTSLIIASGATGLSRAIFQGTVGNARGFIDYDNSTCGFIIRTNESTALTISNAGVSTFVGNVCSPNHIASSTCSTAGLRVYGASGTHQWDMYLNGANLRFSDNTSGGCLVVDSLSTFSSTITAVDINIKTSDPSITLTPNSGTYAFFQKLSTANGDYLRLYDGTAYSMRFINGNVGINVVPTENLTIYGAVIRLEGAAGVSPFAIANNNSSGFRIYDYTAGVNRMVITCVGNTGLKTDNPCTAIHVEGGYGSRWGGNGCFYGGGISGGQMPYGDIYGNGASYTYQTCNGNSNNSSLNGGFAAGYFKGGPGCSYGGGGAGIVAIGGNGGNAESVNAGGGAGIFARGGLNGAATALSYAGWFDGGDVMVRCGSVLSCAPNNGYNFRALGFATGVIASGGSCLIFSNLDRGLYLISIASSVTSTFGYSAFLWVDSSNITVSSVIRQSCVAITTSGRYLCVVNQYTSEAASMTVTTLNLLNYIG